MILGKDFHTSHLSNSLHLDTEGVGENSEPVLQNYFCFVRLIIPNFHQSNLISMNERFKLLFTRDYLKAEFTNARNIERMQHKPNSLVSPTLRCIEQDEKCHVT